MNSYFDVISPNLQTSITKGARFNPFYCNDKYFCYWIQCRDCKENSNDAQQGDHTPAASIVLKTFVLSQWIHSKISCLLNVSQIKKKWETQCSSWWNSDHFFTQLLLNSNGNILKHCNLHWLLWQTNYYQFFIQLKISWGMKKKGMSKNVCIYVFLVSTGST